MTSTRIERSPWRGRPEINAIHLMDCLQGMDRMGDETVDVVVTSPPYNIGKKI